MNSLLAWYEAEVTKATGEAFSLLMKEPYRRCYIWFTRGRISAAFDQPEGMEIATAEHVPANRTKDGMRVWIWETCRRLECLPHE